MPVTAFDTYPAAMLPVAITCGQARPATQESEHAVEPVQQPLQLRSICPGPVVQPALRCLPTLTLRVRTPPTPSAPSLTSPTVAAPLTASSARAMSSEHLSPPQPVAREDRSSVGRADSYADSANGNNNMPYIPPAGGSAPALGPSIPGTPVGAYATPPTGSIPETTAFVPPNQNPRAGPGSKEELATGAASDPYPYRRPRPWYSVRRPWIWLIAFFVLAAVVLVVVLPVWFVAVKHHGSGSSRAGGGSSGGDGNGGGGGVDGATWGGNGSEVLTDNGTTFTYINNFGGYWVYDAANPFNNSARPNSWTPPLSEPWNFSTNRIHGVNLGGLFVMEPFITPKYYQQFDGAVDEWTLDVAFRAHENITAVMEAHYGEFVTEQDIAEMAGAGLNWIRLPIPFWAVDVWDDVGTLSNGTTVGEPFVPRMCWGYILRVFRWARKYGIRINLDLHTIPGSQNGACAQLVGESRALTTSVGYNHSGKLGSINFLNGMMGIANAERALEYIRVIAEFISQVRSY